MDIYHIYNRGVDKRDIVKDDGDRIRFVSDLFELNNQNIVSHPNKKDRRDTKQRKPLVHIHAWVLMNNHYHLLLSAIEDETENISRFAQKLGMGYAKFFNEKHRRSGVLWQGVFKKVLIERDAHFLHIPFYIHLNPLDYSFPQWRDGAIRNAAEALEKLSEYRWSSYFDYVGRQNFPSIITKDFLSEVLGSRSRQEKIIRSIISDPDAAPESTKIEM